MDVTGGDGNMMMRREWPLGEEEEEEEEEVEKEEEGDGNPV